MRDLLKRKIYNGELLEAVELSRTISIDDLEESLMDWAFVEPSMIVYTFLCKRLENDEDAALHSLTADILCHPLCHLDGAYRASFYHAKECVRLEPQNVSYKEFLLFFAGIPEKLLDQKLAIQLANDILQDHPNSQIAKGFMEGANNVKFPKDEDGQVLKMLYKRGVNFNQLHEVDFFIAVPNQDCGEKVLSEVKKLGLTCELQYEEEFEEWTCICSKEMLLNYEDIVEIQNDLNELSRGLGGYVDGWGTFAE